MKRNEIKHLLDIYIQRYKENLGTFDSILALSDFFNFIITEKSIKNIIKEPLLYATQQAEIIASSDDEENARLNPKNIKLDVNNVELWPDFGIFQKEQEKLAKMQKDAEPTNIRAVLLPVYLTYMISFYGMIEETKMNLKNGDTSYDEVVSEMKEFPSMLIPMKTIENGVEKTISLNLSSFFLDGLITVASYINNELSVIDFLNKKNATPYTYFDKNNSILHIKNIDIEISRKNDISIDHSILEFIFSRKDKLEQADFSEIAEFRHEEYDGKKQRYFKACKRLNEKIAKSTSNQINDFLDFSSGKTGWCKIKPKYL